MTDGPWMFSPMLGAVAGEMMGSSLNQKGKDRFVHLDDLSSNPRPHIWTY
jgi:hypothetical protein